MKNWIIFFIATSIALVLLVFFSKNIQNLIPKKYYNYALVNVKSRFYVNRLNKTYGDQIDILGKEFNLPSNYLKALIILERYYY